jgi:uncharacterized protein (TIGR02757 family)
LGKNCRRTRCPCRVCQYGRRTGKGDGQGAGRARAASDRNGFIEDEKINLEDIYKREKTALPGLINNDPVEFVHRYLDGRDREIAGFFASQFAYGKIDSFKRFLEDLLGRMGDSPYLFVAKGDFAILKGLYYRFQKEEEIVLLFNILRRMINEFGGIGNMLKFFYEGDVRRALWNVRKHFLKNDRDLIFFFPKQLPSNPMKRWNLYIRWMVRRDEIDIGLWDFMDKKDLIVPLDTHVFKIANCMGWINSKTPSYRAAVEITNKLKIFSPEDPLKYDFLLCHGVGIGAGCTGIKNPGCFSRCVLVSRG